MKIRIAGIDCPETVHKPGESGQVYGVEAKSKVTELIHKKQVSLKVLDRHQYGRLVASVLIGEVDLGLYLLRNGYAFVYTGKGASYGNQKRAMEDAFEYAKNEKLGMFSGSLRVETPAEYKKKLKNEL